MMVDKTELLAELPFFHFLSEEEKINCCQRTEIRHFSKGEILFTYAGSCVGMLYLLSGKIRVSMLSEDGRQITLFYLEKGESCVLSASCVIHHLSFETSLTAAEDSEVFLLGSDAFLQLSEQNLHVKCFQYELLAERFSQVMTVMQDILFHRLDEKIAGYLLKKSKDLHQAELYLTHEELSADINAARESVTRVLKQMSREGLLELHRGMIRLNDFDRLRELCDHVTE